MRNNEYTATPNWFKQKSTDTQTNIYQTNYYLGGSTGSGGNILSSINLYNKYIINTYRLTIEDLFIPNTAIIAVDSELSEGQERPEDFVSEVGKLVSAQDWYTSYSIRVLSNTVIKTNLKSNTSRYGIVFYDKHNTPISGYTPTENGLVDIQVPETANYFRCCHQIESESEQNPFYIEYQSVNIYNDTQLNEAYSGIFEDFTKTDNDIQEGITKDVINNRALNLIFQQPLQFTTDKAGNIKIELNNDILKDTLLSTDYVTTIENNPQDILSQKDFKQGLKINGIEVVEKNGFILIKGNLATTGGITAYTEDPDDPGSGGNPSGSGTIASIEIVGEGNALTNVILSEDKSSLTFEKNWLLDATTDQEVTGVKDFINGIRLNHQLIKIENGILYLDCSVALTGGLTIYAQGEQSIPDIWEGAPFDNVTIHYNPTTKLIEVIGSAGSSFDEEAMWTALASSDSSKQINASHLSNALSGYATESWVRSQGYATQSALNSVSSKLNDFLEGSDTDTIINKWKELEAFLSGMTESDNLAEILSTKADKSYVTSELTKYVTLATEQDITAIKHFTQGLSVGTSKHKIYEKDGAVILEGNLLVTGGITAYSDGSSSSGSSGGLDVDLMWEILGGTGTQQINKSHLTTALSGYATESWVTSKNYATKSTTLAGYGITDAYTKTESDSYYFKDRGVVRAENPNLLINGAFYTDSISPVEGLYSYGTLLNFRAYPTNLQFYILDNNSSFYFRSAWNSQTQAQGTWYKIWSDGNDGSGSGLDADLLDGIHANNLLYSFNDNDFDPNTYDGYYVGMTTKSGISTDWWHILSMSWCKGNTAVHKTWVSQLALPTQGRSGLRYRSCNDGASYSAWVKVWDESNDGSGSGLDADTVDGFHSIDTITFGGDINSPNYYEAGLKVFGITGGSNQLGNGWGSILQLCNGTARNYTPNTQGRADLWYSQLILTTDNRVRARFSTNGSEWTGQLDIAYITDNVASATKLQTARSLWGQYFDGQQDVSGNILNTQTVKSKDNVYLDLSGHVGIAFYTYNTFRGVINSSGNFGIGTESPSAALHVVGDILATGGITCYTSDSRAKTILEELNLSLKDIAESPTIRFKWNGWKIKDDDKTHIGGIAQYVQKILPETILEADGMLNLDYATTAYIYSVQTARHLNTYETRTDRKIKKLEKEIKILKRKLKKLGYEEVNTLVN